MPFQIEKLIEVAPFAKERPRLGRKRNGDSVVYMTDGYKMRQTILRQQFGPIGITGLVSVDVIAYMEMPASWPPRKRSRMRGKLAKVTPDVDNIAGAVLDSLFPTGDVRVCAISCLRRWAETAALRIKITALEGD